MVLFDIDDTLTHGVAEHKKAFSYAFKKVFNVNVTIDVIDHSGKTERQIILETLKKKGLEEPVIRAKMKECSEAIVEYYGKAVKRDNIVVLEGVKRLLEELKKRVIRWNSYR